MSRSEGDKHRTARRTVTSRGRTIVVARYAGYCYGVERALKLTDEAVGRFSPPIYTLGPIIHNPAVVEQLAARGVAAVDDPDQVERGTIVVRTHGIPPAVKRRARRRGLIVVDATCPFVTVAQKKASSLREGGYVVVILGERDHPEVAGLKACAGDQAIVVEAAAELDPRAVRGKRVGIVVQTTQSYRTLADLVSTISPVARETLVYNTICEATEQRQAAACEVAGEVDVVVVVGGRNSANTRRLAGLCREIQPRTHHIERAAELEAAWFVGCGSVGVTAGASTPDEEIDAAVAGIERILAAD
jgi:4-hydroxy-3-methylbut-2-enyl diphosphate reductase